MSVIWKFLLEVKDRQGVRMPEQSKILKVDAQQGKPCLWAVVPDPTKYVQEVRKIVTIGTGHEFEVDDDLECIGSYQIVGGDFVGHVFEDVS